MVMKTQLINKIKNFLRKAGFDLFEYRRGCFDIVAKRDKLILIKVLTNIDSFQANQARELKILAKTLSAHPIIVGSRTRKNNLEDDMIYERFSLPAITFNTLKSTLKGNYPQKLRKRGGIFGKISPDKLKEARKNKGMTQTELARELGVTQKNISEHEKGLEKIRYPVIKIAENVLDVNIKKDFDPLERNFKEENISNASESKKNQIAEHLTNVGFNISYTKRSPPDMIVEEKVTILSSIGGSRKKIKKTAKCLSKFSKISESPAFIVHDKDDIPELPALSRDDLTHIRDAKELVKIIKEKKPY